MIRWSLVEQEYEKDIFAETAWQPQLAILAVLTEFMQRRIDAGELHGDAQKLAMVFLGIVFMHALGRKKFPNSSLHRGDPDDGASLLYRRFSQRGKEHVMDTREADQQKTIARAKGKRTGTSRGPGIRTTSRFGRIAFATAQAHLLHRRCGGRYRCWRSSGACRG